MHIFIVIIHHMYYLLSIKKELGISNINYTIITNHYHLIKIFAIHLKNTFKPRALRKPVQLKKLYTFCVSVNYSMNCMCIFFFYVDTENIEKKVL